MNKRIILSSLLFMAAQVTTKAQMTIGGNYKPSHTLVVKGQVKIDTVKAGSLTDFLISIGDDSVLHRLPISGVVAASQTNISAGTNVTITGAGSAANPYVISSPTTNTLSGNANNLISTVNGTAAATTLVRSVNNTSTTNTLTTTVNGVSASGVNIINANTNSLSQSGGLVNTVNGVAASTAIPAGTLSNVLGYSSTGTPVYQSASTVLSGATTNTLEVSGNTLSSTVNGVAATASLIGTVSNTSTANTINTSVNGQSGSNVNIINSNTNSLSQSTGLVTTVNGVAATTSIPTGTVTNMLGYSSAGTPVYQSPASVLTAASTNTLTSTGGTLTSTVNGKMATAPVLISANNGLTATSGNVALGGALTATTTIAGGANKLSVTSSSVDGFAVDGTTLSVDAANHRVGMGTNAPATALDVRASTAGTALRIADGTQGTGKVLVSDANGSAIWSAIPGNTTAITGTLSTNQSNNLALASNNYTGAFITLPAGKWLVQITMVISINGFTNPTLPSGYSVWTRSTLSDASSGTGNASADISGTASLVSGGATGPVDYGLLSGSLIINNTSGANKTYYYWQRAGTAYTIASLNVLNLTVLGTGAVSNTNNIVLRGFGTNTWSENQIVATPIN